MSQRASARGRWGLLAVVVSCLALRGYVICRTEVVAQDSAEYLRMAERIRAEGLTAVRSSRFHPGYPMAVMAMEGVLRGAGVPVGPVTWDLAGQLVAMFFAAAATALAWKFAANALDARIATLGILVFTVTREWTTVGADALSDTMAVAFQMVAVVLAVEAERRLGNQSVRATAIAFLSGLAAGGAYLVRPEAIAILFAAIMLLLSGPLRRRGRWSTAGIAVAAATIGAVFLAAPYMICVGSFTPRRDVHDFFHGLIGVSGDRVTAISGDQQTTVRALTEEFIGGMHAVTAGLIVLWAVTWIVWRGIRRRSPGRMIVSPTVESAVITISLLVPHLSMMTIRHIRWGRVSSRYFMLPSLLLAPLAGAAIWILAQWVRDFTGRLGRGGRWMYRVYWVLIAAMLVALTIHAARPLHAYSGHLRLAGEYVASVTEPGDRILTSVGAVAWYADRPSRLFLKRRLDDAGAIAHTCWRQGCSVVVIEATPKKALVVVNPLRRRLNLHLLKSFPSPNPKKESTIYIYRFSIDEDRAPGP